MENQVKSNPPPGGKKRGLKAARRHKVGVLWLKGNSVRDIADLIRQDPDLPGAEKTSPITVHKDIQAIKGDLKERSIDELEIQRARSINHLRMIQRDAWDKIEGYEVESSYEGTVIKYQFIPSAAPLLNVIAICEEKIAKLEGTFAPVELTGKGGRDLIPRAPFILELPEGGIYEPPEPESNGYNPALIAEN